MNVLDEAKKRPVMSGITLVGAAGAVLLFMNVMPGLELLVSIKKAPVIAEAALKKAEEANDWIAAYIKEQQKQRELDQKLAEQAAEYQRQMLELQRQQQQQMPNRMYRPEPPRIWQERAEDGYLYCTDGQESWWPNERGECD